MKKKAINAFTLVEMLIVIVIIGILIAALMPRMQAAQGRARDVSRKTALSQIQSAIVTSQGDKGRRPGICKENEDDCTTDATAGLDINEIRTQLMAAGMNSIPTDPLDGTKVKGLGDEGGEGQYRYMVTTRNGTEKGGFVLMAKTEVEGGSNWVVCDTAGEITTETDIADQSQFSLCTTFEKDTSDSATCSLSLKDGDENPDGKCTYTSDAELRYVLAY